MRTQLGHDASSRALTSEWRFKFDIEHKKYCIIEIHYGRKDHVIEAM